jgi:hypothetical protein
LPADLHRRAQQIRDESQDIGTARNAVPLERAVRPKVTLLKHLTIRESS